MTTNCTDTSKLYDDVEYCPGQVVLPGTRDHAYFASKRSIAKWPTLPLADAESLDKVAVYDGDFDDGLPLIIAFDANANINWCVVGQVGDDGKLRVVKSFYVKYERKIPELMDDFCDYYMYFLMKRVIFYYDSTFISNNYALHNYDFHDTICNALRRNGWHVDDVFVGRQMEHIKKQALINRMLQGRANHQVLINKDNNRDLLLSIQTAGVYLGKKDKRGEKLAETEEDKLENRTDGNRMLRPSATEEEIITSRKRPKIP